MLDSLNIESFNINEIIKNYKLPIYIYYETLIEKQLDILQRNFKDFNIFYSFKSNPNKDICSTIKKQGYFADTASIGELRLALSCGFIKDEIIFSSPGKKIEEIDEALGKCILIADSLNELKIINEVCSRRGIVEEIGIRINPNYSLTENAAQEVMSGVPSKFGIDQLELKNQLDYINSLKNIKIIGIQIYMGSQIIDPDILYDNFYNIFKIASFCKNDLCFKLKFIDFGGGFGIQYTEKDKKLNIQLVGKRIMELKNSKEFEDLSNSRFIIESGRFICASSGVYVTPVLDIKISRGKKYAILDGGMNTFLRPVLIKENNYPIAVINKLNIKNKEKVTLGGVMCTPIDIFQEDIMLSPLEIGDIIAFFNAGAYGYTMSLTKFISHEEVEEVFISKEDL